VSSDLQQRLITLLARTGELFGSPTLEDVLPGILRLAVETFAADGYGVWRLDRAHRRWAMASHAGVSEEFTSSIVPRPDGTAAKAPSDPIAAEDVMSLPMLALRRDAYAREGIRSMLAIPLTTDEPGTATLVFYYRERQRFASEQIEIARALGHLAGAALRTAELYSAQLRRETEAQFLARAGQVLAASLDYHETLKAVAQLAVPQIADWCAVDVLDASGLIEQLAVAHADPARVAYAREFLRKYPADPRAPVGLHQVLRTGESHLLPELTPAMIERGARSPQHRADIEALRITSYMIVPLRTREGIAGAMTFVSAESRRHFTRADLRFAETVADRAGVAIENARAYDEARRANRLKDDFLATLSHELRTPLNAIAGYARMLRTDAVPDDRRAHAVEVIERNSGLLAQIVEDILDVSSIISGKLQLKLGPVDLNQLLADAVATVAPAAEGRRVGLYLHDGPAGMRLHADGDRLRQVIGNLLANAVKFTPSGGRVDVSAEAVDGGVEIAVADTGRGIPSAFLPFIFDRFRQADSRFTREHGGLGLGLSIARNLVEMHGGTIEASSDGDGHGATFRVRLPMAARAERP
jgi:signal transduction histidine kinase